MSVSTNIQIAIVEENNEVTNSFTTTVPCDQLAYMLFDWAGNCFTNSKSVLNEDEVKIVKATFSKDSLTVQDGLEKFMPNIVLISELAAVLIKIRNKVLWPNLKEQITKGDDYEISKLNRDIIGISECIGALEVFKINSQRVFIAIEDF